MNAADALILSDDLLFVSRVSTTARAAGRTIAQIRDPATLMARVLAESPTCVLLDLQFLGDKLNRTIDALRAATPRPHIVAYGSHVDAETLHAARQAGCDVVLPRSAFAERLEVELPQWLTRPS